jgi:hypothetical protein
MSLYIRTIGFTFIEHIMIKNVIKCLGQFKPEHYSTAAIIYSSEEYWPPT